jgi:dipeptidyl aminopeptidase/acylaminoacyl peptidase
VPTKTSMSQTASGSAGAAVYTRRGARARLRSLGRAGRNMAMAAALLPCAVASTTHAQDTSGEQKPLTPESSLNLKFLSDLQLSPDGNRLAFVVTEPPTDDGRATHIWLYDQRSNVARQFTYSKKSEKSPRWSPDGKQLAFLSNRPAAPGEEEQQIYVMRAEGGEATPVTRGKRSINFLAWSPDGKQIAFLAPDAKSEAEEKKEKEKNDARVTDKDAKHARIWLLNPATQESKVLTDAKWEVSEIAWLASNDGFLAVATDHPEADQETNRIFAVRISDGSMAPVAAPHGPFGSLKLSLRGGTASYVGSREDGPEPHDLMLLDVSSNGRIAPKNLTGMSLDRQIFDYHWTTSGGLLLIAADGFRTKFHGIDPQGVIQDAALALPDETLNPATMASSGDHIFFVGQSATRPQELFFWDKKTPPVQLTRLNAAWKQYALGQPEIYKYKSFDGVEIEAALLKPANTAGKAALPLITLIHGGPTGAWQDAVETWGQLLAAHGYAVFYPNIRGSIGYGQKFIEMNRGDWGGADFKDVMAGVDDLVAKGIADPDRLGIGGWSYGGYMSEWAITQTTRFKAAVSGAGLANLISEYGTEQGPSYDEWFYGLPYEKPDGFLNSSPFVYLKNAKTPMLILQGDADTTDPPGQSQELYRGLKRYGVETELVMYPREPHGFHEQKHLLDRLNRILTWYDQHLKTPPSP